MLYQICYILIFLICNDMVTIIFPVWCPFSTASISVLPEGSWRFASYFQSLLVQVLWSVSIINCTWVVIPSLFSYNYIYNYIYMVSPLLTFSNSPISVVSKSLDIISSNFLVWFYIVAVLYFSVTFIWSLPSLVWSVL